MSLFSELKRRHVVRVGIAYTVVGWVIAQVAEFALETFEAPSWILKAMVIALLAGLPVAMALAWVFELTPQGVRRDTGDRPSAGGESGPNAAERAGRF